MESVIISKLPAAFVERMKALLAQEYYDFEASYCKAHYCSLRVNTLKLSANELKLLWKGQLDEVGWCDSGFYYDDEQKPGKHPYHEAGLYYIQEASAMSVVEALGVEPGDVVLDLCSAPGGKATQIACKLAGSGLLIANEIVPSRAKILSQNIERMGIPNAVVTNNSPYELEDKWKEYFDKIVVDAPCSGEGMFRKNPQAIDEWSEESVAACAQRQGAILDSAYKMLGCGGKMVYSTCTFEIEENEKTIEQFLNRHCDMRIVEPMVRFEDCKIENTQDKIKDIVLAQRIFPHKVKGEGHFFCVMQKQGEEKRKATFSLPCVLPKQRKVFDDWQKDNLNVKLSPTAAFGDNLYAVPQQLPTLKGVKVLRCGLQLGEIKKDRFEPSHSLAIYLQPQWAKRIINCDLHGDKIFQYFDGNTLDCGFKGWGLVCVDGFACGWCKGDGQQAKNHYPKGLRKNLRV
ncbi:MAG: RsmB/NOP family class I SAM-dependent RNA methyltransferase [Christensenellales bacterium]